MMCLEKDCIYTAAEGKNGLCLPHWRDKEAVTRRMEAHGINFTPDSPPKAEPIAPSPNGQGRKPGDNYKQEHRDRAAELLKEGRGTREVANTAGLSHATVLRVRDEIKDELPKECTCGKPLGHKGMCKDRLAKSPARQKVVAALPHGKRQIAKIPEGSRYTISEIRAMLEAERIQLQMRLSEIEMQLEAVATVTEIATKLGPKQ